MNKIKLLHQHFYLLPERAVYWKKMSAIIVSDLHFGKAAHFRKAGIAISDEVFINDMINLDKIIHQFNANKLLVVGDMFHSDINSEVSFFSLWQKHIKPIEVILVKGNHDIMNDEVYNKLSFQIYNNQYENENFVFIHEPPASNFLDENKFYFFGHLHPKVTLKGNGQQQLTLPCFYFTVNTCTLPAFSKFTGGSSVKPRNSDSIYVIAGNEVLKL